ncbi:MAG TPA: chloride channel protein [Pseudolabrys sp.]|uniref:chloride channel protein n=1 Tax=Pseudolabrys sp. TaxID=1960880 RepID=UPI002DDCB466|nr:chloride channel protein [Pseudolabrys sp.]HEV2630990.1 chloride channel protein [Pseudolabrys sp.]
MLARSELLRMYWKGRPLEVPHRLRAIVRARESSIIVLAAAVGLLSGLVVAAMSESVGLMHLVFFGLDPGERLSARAWINPVYAFLTPCLGGLVFGLVSAYITRKRGTEVDPIEANALHGGRMSLRGSLIVAAQTVWSSGVGASVGLEAGYTQFASGVASVIGRAFRLRRADMRVLVGCGSAAAIAGAFGAPLAGAFYAFELVIGTYSIASLAPVGIAALVGYLTARTFAPLTLGIEANAVADVTVHDVVIAAGVGLLAAMVGILLMRGVAACERLFTRMRIAPEWRPMIGGSVVGLLAIITPQVMSSGHGAMHLTGIFKLPIEMIALIFVLKIVASIISLGSGFRGGLFFASLLLGALGGQLFATGFSAIVPGVHIDPDAYAIIGLSALSVSVIGGPLTMTFIALETTGDLWLTTAVLIAAIISMQVTREFFGYTFATWRFHLRGETIRSAADIGWIRDLSVGQMMRPDVRTTPAEGTISDFREAFPLGSTSQVVAVDEDGRYAGMVLVAEAHAADVAAADSLRGLLRHSDHMLLPQMSVQEAIAAFDRFEAEALPVVDSVERRQVVGLLSEAHALRRYSEASERQRRELLGEF